MKTRFEEREKNSMKKKKDLFERERKKDRIKKDPLPGSR